MSSDFTGSPVKQVRWVGRAAVIDAVGDIDLHRSTALQETLMSVAGNRPERIVVNLADVRYMDSSGVASFVKLLSRARRRGIPLVLVGMNDRVRSVFEITRLDSVFDIRATEAEALS